MQLEYPGKIKGRIKTFPSFSDIKKFIGASSLVIAFKNFSRDTFYCAGVSAKVSLSKLLSVAVAICSAVSFFHFFTVGTSVSVNGERIGTAISEKSFSDAFSEACSIAAFSGISLSDMPVSTSFVFTLKKDLLPPEKLCDNILLSDKAFTKACSLYCNSTLIFTAANEKEARAAVNKYMSDYSMNGTPEIPLPLEYKEQVVLKSSVSEENECVQILKENETISVTSVLSTVLSEPVPYDTETVPDNSLYIGDSVTITEGVEGNIETIKETVYENGTEISNRIISKEVISAPVTKVVKVGTKNKNILKSGVIYPLHGTLSSPFGERWGRMHEGIDIAVEEGTPVKAAECGTVCYVSENAGGYGKFIRIDHGYGVMSSYAHLSKIEVSEGDTVSAGTVIALSGNTGRSTGPHLHFEITENDIPLDPMAYLK